MQYHSESDIQEAYGWEFISEQQYERYLELFRQGRKALDEHSPTVTELALSILNRIFQDIDRDCRQCEFEALSPEEQLAELKRAEESKQAWRRGAGHWYRAPEGRGQARSTPLPESLRNGRYRRAPRCVGRTWTLPKIFPSGFRSILLLCLPTRSASFTTPCDNKENRPHPKRRGALSRLRVAASRNA